MGEKPAQQSLFADHEAEREPRRAPARARAGRPGPLRLEDLPETAREIVEVIGLPKALRLVEELGGTSFPLPRGEWEGLRVQMLAEVVGEAATRRLIEHYAGTPLYIPSCAAAMRAARDRAIQSEYLAGTPAYLLALKYRLSERHIWRILKVTV